VRGAGEWTERRPGPPGWLTLHCELDHLDAPVGRRLPTCAAAPTVDGPLERKCVRDATALHVAGPGRATLARDRRAFSYSTAERRKRNLFSPVVARASQRGRRALPAGSSSAPRWRARATGGRSRPRPRYMAGRGGGGRGRMRTMVIMGVSVAGWWLRLAFGFFPVRAVAAAQDRTTAYRTGHNRK
jgi:hypothetical protein